MTPRGYDSSILVLLFALVIAAVAACSSASDPSTSSKPGKGVYVPVEWKTARRVSNHRIHVAREHVPCASCHELGNDSMGPVTPARCAVCHEKESRFEHARTKAQARFGPEAHVDCTTCHAFKVDGADLPPDDHFPTRQDGGIDAGPSPHVPPPTDCMRCHRTAQDSAPAVEVHGSSECVKCHVPHEDTKHAIGPCPECHQKIATGHGAKSANPAEACIACHSHQHAPAAAALTSCAGCHAVSEPRVPASALFEGGHEQCVGCHRPHDFTKATAAPCRSCHEDVHVIAEGRVKAHARCENCHAPHDVRAVGDAACQKCHSTVHPDHPGVLGKTCTSCHDPHPANGHASAHARSCTGCHQTAASKTDFHGGVACEKCHAPHDFGLSLAEHSSCTGCHQKQVTFTAALAGHGKCEGCHRGLPHRPDRLEAPCDSCHASIASSARSGHQQCKACHEPHGGTLVAECKSCHAVEQRTAPMGHQACTQCHDEHTGSSAQAVCGKCHAREQATPHGKLGDSCTSCHRPHGPGGVAVPPPCKACHETAKLPGLHSIKEHADCTNCHEPHGEQPSPVRVMCVSCHKDRANHFPDAPSCGSCHLFGPSH